MAGIVTKVYQRHCGIISLACRINKSNSTQNGNKPWMLNLHRLQVISEARGMAGTEVETCMEQRQY